MTPRRFATLAGLVLAAVITATAVCLVNGAVRVGAPFPGFLMAENRTVFSIGRPGWSIEQSPRAFFSQAIAIDGRPITHAGEIQAAVAALPVGSTPRYRFRKGADVFSAVVATQRFTWDDFFAVYGTYALVGLVFAATGLWAVWRCRRAARVPHAVGAFFVLCQCVGLALGTAGDVYGPYWFVPLYFAAQCATFAALVHLAVSYPQPLGVGSRWRPVGIGLVYACALALAAALVLAGDDVGLFVPLLYVVYLLLANSIFLYLAALASGFSGATPETRVRLWRALAGVIAVVALPAMIFLIYPILERSISPIELVGPLVLFPLLTVSALPRRRDAEAEQGTRSVRLRLSLLFLGAVETSFLIAVAVFWQSNSWAQLLDEVLLNQQQRGVVERLLAEPATPHSSGVEDLDAVASTVADADLAAASRAALRRGDAAGARRALVALGARLDGTAARLEARRRWIGGLAIPVLTVLLGIAVLQAVAFAAVVRRWMIGPLDRIAAATGVIATGDLAHRLAPEPTEEFSRLGRAVNVMAASLQAIQRRVEMARFARQRAAGAARDVERRRLARELHDGILQDLTELRLRLLAEQAQAGRASDDAAAAVARVIAAIRGVVDDLRPPALRGVSLAEAIAGHARVLAFARGTEVVTDLSGAEDVPDWAARDLYRIAQEATANALRHAGARRVAVRLTRAGGDLVLEVEDDGVGFDPERTPLGSGVEGMRERAAALGGDLEIERAAPSGTRVRVVLRLPPAGAADGAPPA